MRVMPGTHRGNTLPHEDTYHADNMLTRGQAISAGIDEEAAVYMPLEAGQMSIHSYCLAHASGANHSPDRRIGISMHFMPTDTEQIVGDWDSAALVRGVDEHHHFRPTVVPASDFDPTAVDFHAQATEQLSRTPKPLPTMTLNPSVKSLSDFTFDDFTLSDYQPHPHISAPVAV